MERKGMSADLVGNDNDVDVEDAYFTGDEAPGGENPTPDQDAVDDIGRALGVQYEDNEELKASDKVVERDRHRWELDPASSEDYRDRKEVGAELARPVRPRAEQAPPLHLDRISCNTSLTTSSTLFPVVSTTSASSAA